MEESTEYGQVVGVHESEGWRSQPPSLGEPRGRLRVACFLDIPNLETSAYQRDVEFDPAFIKNLAEACGRVVTAKAYGIASRKKPISRGVFEASRAGFEFVARVLVEEGRKDIDAQMTADIVAAICEDEAEVILVASGDSDFLAAVRLAKKRGKQVVIISIEGCCSGMLAAEADELILLGEDGPATEREDLLSPPAHLDDIPEVGYP